MPSFALISSLASILVRSKVPKVEVVLLIIVGTVLQYIGILRNIPELLLFASHSVSLPAVRRGRTEFILSFNAMLTVLNSSDALANITKT